MATPTPAPSSESCSKLVAWQIVAGLLDHSVEDGKSNWDWNHSGVENAPGFCFTAHSTVEVFGKGRVSMRDLCVGDEVLVSPGVFEPVTMWLHRDETRGMPTVSLITPHQTLECSLDHFVMDGRGLPVKAGTAPHQLTLGNGSVTDVLSVRHGHASGLYAPLTASGKIVVDGVVCSCFAHVDHNLARAFFDLAASSLLPSVERAGDVESLLRPLYGQAIRML